MAAGENSSKAEDSSSSWDPSDDEDLLASLELPKVPLSRTGQLQNITQTTMAFQPVKPNSSTNQEGTKEKQNVLDDALDDYFSDSEAETTLDDEHLRKTLELPMKSLERVTLPKGSISSSSSSLPSISSRFSSLKRKNTEMSLDLGFDLDLSSYNVPSFTELENLPTQPVEKKKKAGKANKAAAVSFTNVDWEAAAILKREEEDKKLKELLKEHDEVEEYKAQQSNKLNQLVLDAVGKRIFENPKYKYFIDNLQERLDQPHSDDLFDFIVGMDSDNDSFFSQVKFSERVVSLEKRNEFTYGYKEAHFTGGDICVGVPCASELFEQSLFLVRPAQFDLQSLVQVNYNSFDSIDSGIFYKELLEQFKNPKGSEYPLSFMIHDYTAIDGAEIDDQDYSSLCLKDVLKVNGIEDYSWRSHKYSYIIPICDEKPPFIVLVLRLRKFALRLLSTLKERVGIDQSVDAYQVSKAQDFLLFWLFRLVIAHLLDYRTIHPNVTDYQLPGLRSDLYHQNPITILNKLLMQISIHYLKKNDYIDSDSQTVEFSNLLNNMILPILDDFTDPKLIFRFINNLVLLDYQFIKDLKSWLMLNYIVKWDFNDDLHNTNLTVSHAHDGYRPLDSWRANILSFECYLSDSFLTEQTIVLSLYKYLGRLYKSSLKNPEGIKPTAFNQFNQGLKEKFDEETISHICAKNVRYRILLLNDLMTLHFPSFTSFDYINKELHKLYIPDRFEVDNADLGSISAAGTHRSLSATPIGSMLNELPKLHTLPNVEQKFFLLFHMQSYLNFFKNEYFQNYKSEINPIFTDCLTILNSLHSLMNREIEAKEIFY